VCPAAYLIVAKHLVAGFSEIIGSVFAQKDPESLSSPSRRIRLRGGSAWSGVVLKDLRSQNKFMGGHSGGFFTCRNPFPVSDPSILCLVPVGFNTILPGVARFSKSLNVPTKW
jgi:hypothetical protein